MFTVPGPSDSNTASPAVIETPTWDDHRSSLDRHSASDSSVDLSSAKDYLEGRAVRRSHLPPLNAAQSARPIFSPANQASYELPVQLLQPLDAERSRRRSFAIQPPAAPGVAMTEPQDTSGAEILPSLFTASAPPSVRIEQFEVEEAPSLERARFSRKRYLHFTAICWVFFVNGWNDGTTGPLLPKIQEYYHIGFAVVSLIFIFNCVGYIIGVLANVHLTDRLGLGKVLVLGSCLQLVAYAMQSPGGPYPLMVVAYAIGGCGLALQNAQGTGFVGSFDKHDHVFMGVLQASYGLGAFTAPLVATHFASSRHWSFHFLISAGLAISNTVSLLAVFRLRNQDDVMAEAGQAPGEVGTASGSKYSQMMGLRSLHLLAAFALIYVGTEVTLGGWIVTYVIKERAGGTSAGYISSGFFGGMTVGRVALIWLNRLVGERRILYIYIVLAIALEMTVWLVPSLLQNALAISAIGVLLGPMYPILVGQASRILPRWLLTGALGWIAGVGQAGSALLPFITGVLAAQYGIASLQPLLIVMMVSLIGLWAIIPKDHRRVD